MTICVIGVGFVGEHLIKAFSKFYDVIGIDISINRIAVLNNSFHLNNNLQSCKQVAFQSHFNQIENCNMYVVSVPTLLQPDKNIDMTALISIRDKLLHIAQPGSLIMIESSVYVGATRELFKEFLKKGVYVGFSPERVDPGRKLPAIEDIPKLVSGLNEESLGVCKSFYEKVFKTIVPVSSCECAEMCKLYENCFRMVNIAYVNEIADMCDTIGVNVHEMIDASSTKPFGYMPFSPGLGVGGHCIPVNPYYLFKTGPLPILQTSTKLMEHRPRLKALQLIENYNECNNILLIGIGFKKGESLTTNSPGLSLYKELRLLNKNVTVFDPLVQNTMMHNSIQFCSSLHFTQKNLQNFDLIIVNVHLNEYEKEVLEMHQNSGGRVHSFVH